MLFSDLDLMMYVRVDLSGKRRSEGGTSLPDRAEATMEVIMYMATLVTDENTRMWKRRRCTGWRHSGDDCFN